MIDGGSVGVTSVSRELLEELWLLFRTVGVDGAVQGPYKADHKGHLAFRLRLSVAQTYTYVGWGRAARLRTRQMAPRFEVRRVLLDLIPTTRSDVIVRNRLRRGDESTSPYILARMGGTGLYDQCIISASRPRRAVAPVYTLSVEAEEHSYVAQGFISKNSIAGELMGGHGALGRTMESLPWDVFGPGLLFHGHDSLMVEVENRHEQYAREALKDAMTDSISVDGRTMPMPAECRSGTHWSDLHG